MSSGAKSGPTHRNTTKNPPRATSPGARQAAREAAEAAALAELEAERAERRAKSATLRKLRLAAGKR
jgi:hypothetical protein